MKMNPVFNYAPYHEQIWGNGGITPHILYRGTRWRPVVSFMAWLLPVEEESLVSIG